MNYQIHPEGFEGQRVEVQSPGFFAGVKLLINGQPAPKGKKRGEMALRRDDGQVVIAKWKPSAMGLDMPQLVIDGNTIPVVEPLKWYQLLWSVLPLVLIFGGGALGGITGAVAMVINLKVMRADMQGVLKYLLTGAISVFALVVYLVLALWLRAALS